MPKSDVSLIYILKMPPRRIRQTVHNLPVGGFSVAHVKPRKESRDMKRDSAAALLFSDPL